jgi:hypothetical protein
LERRQTLQLRRQLAKFSADAADDPDAHRGDPEVQVFWRMSFSFTSRGKGMSAGAKRNALRAPE